MRRNVEVKARLRDPERVERAARELSGGSCELLHQNDTFFRARNGRLKLREFADGAGELIWYHRPDETGPAMSSYVVVPTADPGAVRQALDRAVGLRGVVRKRRRLLLAGRTRIHLDDVEGLGSFLELEVVLRDGESEACGRAEALDLLDRLGVDEADLLEPAYIDLLEAGTRS